TPVSLPAPSNKRPPNIKIQLPPSPLPPPPLLDPIDREAPRPPPRQVLSIPPPQQKHAHRQPAANSFRLPVTHQPPHQSITCRSFAHHRSFPTRTTSSSWRRRGGGCAGS